MVGDAFKALGDPTRRRILELLSEGEMSAGDIAAHFDMAKPSVSHHLNILKNAGLVTDERRGQNIVYCLNLTVFQEAVKWFFDFGFVKGGPDDGRHCVCCYGCCFDCNFTAGHHFGRCRHHDPAAGRCLWRLRLDLPLLLPRLHRQNEVSKRPHPERTLYPASCLISKKGAQRPPPFFFIIYSLFITKRSPLHAVLLCTGRGAFYFYSWVFFPARSVFMRMRSRWDFSSFL